MNAVERIEAAITKLEALKSESIQGLWRSAELSGSHWLVFAATDGSGGGESVAAITSNDGDNESSREPTAELIVTLHRTIDAQLAILRAVVESVPIWVENDGPMTDAELVDNLLFELALADAILGES